MNRQSSGRWIGVVVLACGVAPLVALAPAGAKVPPPDQVGELERKVGQVVEKVAPQSNAPATPLTRRPSAGAPRRPRPAPAAPAAPRPVAQPPAIAPAPSQSVRQVGGVATSSGSRGAAASSRSARANSPASAAKASSGTAPAADPTNDASAAAAPAGADADATNEGSGTLPFTGFQLVSLLLVAALFVVAGASLRRAVRRA